MILTQCKRDDVIEMVVRKALKFLVELGGHEDTAKGLKRLKDFEANRLKGAGKSTVTEHNIGEEVSASQPCFRWRSVFQLFSMRTIYPLFPATICSRSKLTITYQTKSHCFNLPRKQLLGWQRHRVRIGTISRRKLALSSKTMGRPSRKPLTLLCLKITSRIC